MIKCFLKRNAMVWAWILLICAGVAGMIGIFTALSFYLWNTGAFGSGLFFIALVPTGIAWVCWFECKNEADSAERERLRETERDRAQAAHEKEMSALGWRRFNS